MYDKVTDGKRKSASTEPCDVTCHSVRDYDAEFERLRHGSTDRLHARWQRSPTPHRQHGFWLIRPFAVCPLDDSPPGSFAPWLVRPLADSPTHLGRFTPWVLLYCDAMSAVHTSPHCLEGAKEPGGESSRGETAKGRISHNSTFVLVLSVA